MNIRLQKKKQLHQVHCIALWLPDCKNTAPCLRNN